MPSGARRDCGKAAHHSTSSPSGRVRLPWVTGPKVPSRQRAHRQLQRVVVQRPGRQAAAVGVQGGDGGLADLRARCRLAILHADQLEVASIRQPHDPVERAGPLVAPAAGGGQAQVGLELGRRRVRIGAGDDQVVDAADHGDDATSIR